MKTTQAKIEEIADSSSVLECRQPQRAGTEMQPAF
jgi:hypothetical protein